MAHVREEHGLHLGRLFSLASGSVELPGLGFELTRLFLRLSEQFSRPKVSLKNLQAHRDDGQQLVEQCPVSRGELLERCDFEHTEQRVLGQRRQSRHVRGLPLAEARGDAQVAWREVRQSQGAPLLCALADQTLADLDDARSLGHICHAVCGDTPEYLAIAVVQHVVGGHTTAERWHEVRQQVLTKLRERRRALESPGQSRHVGLHPALLVHGGGALFQNVDRTRQPAGFVGGADKGHRLLIIASGNGLDGAVERSYWPDDVCRNVTKAEDGCEEDGDQAGDEMSR